MAVRALEVYLQNYEQPAQIAEQRQTIIRLTETLEERAMDVSRLSRNLGDMQDENVMLQELVVHQLQRIGQQQTVTTNLGNVIDRLHDEAMNPASNILRASRKALRVQIRRARGANRVALNAVHNAMLQAETAISHGFMDTDSD